MVKVTRMNCDKVRLLWDEYRDGTLEGAEARGLEEHLADCPQCEALWRHESAWLAIIGEKAPISTEAESQAFTAATLRRWSHRRQPGIVGRIVRFTAAAATIALMLSLATILVRHSGPGAPASGPLAPLHVAAPPPEAALVAQINAPVLAVREAFNHTSRWLDVDRYVDDFVQLLDTAAPPAQTIRMQ
jgi:anti-sigma factor RsiW